MCYRVRKRSHSESERVALDRPSASRSCEPRSYERSMQGVIGIPYLLSSDLDRLCYRDDGATEHGTRPTRTRAPKSPHASI